MLHSLVLSHLAFSVILIISQCERGHSILLLLLLFLSCPFLEVPKTSLNRCLYILIPISDSEDIFVAAARRLPWDVPTRHVNNMIMKMQYSGYIKKFRYEVVQSALKAYDDRVSADESGIRPLYRPREWKTKERAIEKQRKKNNWYKTRGDDAVIFIPATPK